jgi:hypothetical protein
MDFIGQPRTPNSKQKNYCLLRTVFLNMMAAVDVVVVVVAVVVDRVFVS